MAYVDLMMEVKTSVLCFFLSFICTIRTEGFSVRGPAMPLLVQLGASVTLPCSVDTPIPLHELELYWMREDSGALVHLFQEGESRPESQSPPYRDRAQLFTEEIPKGNYSLLLRNITTEDKGLYKCVVHTEQASNKTQVEIDTERLVVTGADVPVFAYAGKDVTLNCSVDTHVPLRDLEVVWMKTNGEILVLRFAEGQYTPESQDESFRGRAEFFSEEIPKGNFALKLRDVKTEDKGEYMCIVHTDQESVNATAWLKELGFSTLHICILVFSIAAPVFSFVPAVWFFNKTGESNRALLLYYLPVLVPCIMMSIAFAIWGAIESSVGEAYVCSTINLMRILVILKVAVYLPFTGTWYKKLANLALPLEYFLLATGINSVLIRQFLTDHILDTTEKALIGCFCGMAPLIVLSTVFLSVANSPRVFRFLLYSICAEIFFLWYTSPKHGASLLTLGLLFGTFLCAVGVSMLYTLTTCLKTYGYLCQKVLFVLCVILQITFSFQALDTISDKEKERPAMMCFCAFLYILTATTAFQDKGNFPGTLSFDVCSIIIYVIGSAVLTILNSVALATEVFLKAEKGERTVEDLRVIVLPLESLFLACGLCLQVYAYYTRKRAKSCRTRGQSAVSSQNQMPLNTVEMELFSQPAQSTRQTEGNR